MINKVIEKSEQKMAIGEKELQIVNKNAGPDYVGVRKQITLCDYNSGPNVDRPYLIIKMTPYSADNPMVGIMFDVVNYGSSRMNGTGLIQCYIYRANNQVLNPAAHYSGVGFSGNITFGYSSDYKDFYIVIPRLEGGYGNNTYNRWMFDFSCTTLGLSNGSLWRDPDKISVYASETIPTLANSVNATWTKWT